MFDFLMTEAFWVEIIVAALITGICSIVVALIALMPVLHKIRNQLDANENSSAGRHDKRSTEHDRLSAEHASLTQAQRDIRAASSAEHQELRAGITSAAQDLRVLREEQINAKSRQEALTSKQLDIQHTVEQIKALGDEVSRLQSENQRLIQHQAMLEQKNATLRQQLAQAMQRPPASQNRGHAGPDEADEWDREP